MTENRLHFIHAALQHLSQSIAQPIRRSSLPLLVALSISAWVSVFWSVAASNRVSEETVECLCRKDFFYCQRRGATMDDLRSAFAPLAKVRHGLAADWAEIGEPTTSYQPGSPREWALLIGGEKEAVLIGRLISIERNEATFLGPQGPVAVALGDQTEREVWPFGVPDSEPLFIEKDRGWWGQLKRIPGNLCLLLFLLGAFKAVGGFLLGVFKALGWGLSDRIGRGARGSTWLHPVTAKRLVDRLKPVQIFCAVVWAMWLVLFCCVAATHRTPSSMSLGADLLLLWITCWVLTTIASDVIGILGRVFEVPTIKALNATASQRSPLRLPAKNVLRHGDLEALRTIQAERDPFIVLQRLGYRYPGPLIYFGFAPSPGTIFDWQKPLNALRSNEIVKENESIEHRLETLARYGFFREVDGDWKLEETALQALALPSYYFVARYPMALARGLAEAHCLLADGKPVAAAKTLAQLIERALKLALIHLYVTEPELLDKDPKRGFALKTPDATMAPLDAWLVQASSRLGMKQQRVRSCLARLRLGAFLRVARGELPKPGDGDILPHPDWDSLSKERKTAKRAALLVDLEHIAALRTTLPWPSQCGRLERAHLNRELEERNHSLGYLFVTLQELLGNDDAHVKTLSERFVKLRNQYFHDKARDDQLLTGATVEVRKATEMVWIARPLVLALDSEFKKRRGGSPWGETERGTADPKPGR